MVGVCGGRDLGRSLPNQIYSRSSSSKLRLGDQDSALGKRLLT